MDQDFLSLMKLETERLLWFIGFTFTFILAFQYFELPCGNVLVNLFHASKIPVSGAGSDQAAQPPSNFEISDDKTSLNKPNCTDGDALKMANNTRTSEEIKTATNFSFVLKPQVEKNKSSEFYESGEVPAENYSKRSYNGSATRHAGGSGHIIYNVTMGSNNDKQFWRGKSFI